MLRQSTAHLKNQSFIRRLGFAANGLRQVFRRERSFRTQCGFAALAAAALTVLQPGPLWTAAVLLSAGAVLALEMVNGAIECLLDHLHPEHADEIGLAKDAAAGAALVASLVSAGVGAAMLYSIFGG